MTEKEKMLSGRLYIAQDEELARMNQNAKRLIRLFNQTNEEESGKRIVYLKELFGLTGENIWIEPTFHCDYGCHIFVGENFYANYDCLIIDVCTVTIGDHVLFGPRVCVYTAAHPIDAEVRATGLEYGKPVAIGNDVWVGGNTVINPGTTIGNNVVIGSGSVVTKDIPSGVIAAGNPCKVLRPITDEDSKYWNTKRKEYKKGSK
ncbi:sugar O-acetyltransferase [Caproiciproducens sp. NJN-50]|uniref:sugar O-acetyltransferase n=1 Tax=Acutalibacteraceae TaxID=3082771 RepID=UPI000FFE04A3|nr:MULTISPECIES: sugar O-acetyltransferase [Acutalibacteraceae]QAT49585.1 sugar O-acetyltransferase [Caproiciproducens sp. NJN-50]